MCAGGVRGGKRHRSAPWVTSVVLSDYKCNPSSSPSSDSLDHALRMAFSSRDGRNGHCEPLAEPGGRSDASDDLVRAAGGEAGQPRTSAKSHRRSARPEAAGRVPRSVSAPVRADAGAALHVAQRLSAPDTGSPVRAGGQLRRGAGRVLGAAGSRLRTRAARHAALLQTAVRRGRPAVRCGDRARLAGPHRPLFRSPDPAAERLPSRQPRPRPRPHPGRGRPVPGDPQDPGRSARGGRQVLRQPEGR